MESGFQCAGCGEWNITTVDDSAGRTQSYVEDCQVCCKPNLLHIEYDSEQTGICDYRRNWNSVLRKKTQFTWRRTAMSSNYVGPGRMVAHNMVTTQFELDGFRVTRTLGVVRGIVVRSRSIFGTIGAGLQTILGGNITLLTNLCEKTRSEAFDLMLQHAAELGGNAVVGARYDATEVMQGVTEVLAYGTAVFVEPAR